MKTIAIIGCGRVARDAHFPAFAKMNNVRVKYACDIIPGKALKAKEEFPYIECAIENYKIALADPEIDAVFVLTPNFAHYTVTMDALKAGKHVFCEKPITVNYKLSCEMAEEARKQNKLLNIGVCNRYHKSVEFMEEMNRKGEFGNIYHVYCSFRGFRGIPGLGGAFTTKSQSGGGVLIDWGVHFLDLVLYILGGAKIKTASADAYSEIAKNMKSYKYVGEMWAEDTSDVENGTNDVEDFISGYVRTDKASISFNGAWAQNINKDEMYVDILGDKAGARFTYRGKVEVTKGDTLETIVPEYDIENMHYLEDVAFIEALNKGIKTRSHIDNVLETAKLLQALYDSAEEKKEIRFK